MGWPQCRLLEAQLVPDAVKVGEAAFLTKILLAAKPGAGGLSEGREGIVFLQLAQPGECREL